MHDDDEERPLLAQESDPGGGAPPSTDVGTPADHSLGHEGQQNEVQQQHNDGDVEGRGAGGDGRATGGKATDGTMTVGPPIETVDEALSIAGLGKFHVYIFIACGLAYMADAMEVTLLAFLYSCLKKKWDLGDFTAASIVSSVFMGELVGAIVAGLASDKYGRRVVSLVGIGMVGVFGLASAAADGVTSFIILRTLTGVGIGSLIVPFDLLCELTPEKWRGVTLVLFEFWWCVGSLFTVAVAWATLDSGSWRHLIVRCSVPVVLAGVALLWIPESPRWVASQGHIPEAQALVRHIAHWNGNPFRRQLAFKPVPKIEHGNYGELFFGTDEMRKNMVATSIIWFGFGFTFYGIQLLLVRVANVHDDSGCSFSYGFLLAIYATEVAGTAVLLYTIDSLGRVLSQVILYGLSCGGVVLLALTVGASRISAYVFGGVALAAVMGGSSATWVATPEIFPTHVRSTAHSFANSVCRIGALCSGYWVDSEIHIREVSTLLIFLNLLISLTVLVLPETSKVHLS